jgi:hypothetical protein
MLKACLSLPMVAHYHVLADSEQCDLRSVERCLNRLPDREQYRQDGSPVLLTAAVRAFTVERIRLFVADSLAVRQRAKE